MLFYDHKVDVDAPHRFSARPNNHFGGTTSSGLRRTAMIEGTTSLDYIDVSTTTLSVARSSLAYVRSPDV